MHEDVPPPYTPLPYGSCEGDDDIVDSPCVRVCLYDAGLGACSGCLRTLDEIAHWSVYSPDEQRAVLARIARARLAPATG